MKSKAYISGPITGKTHTAILDSFEDAAIRLRFRGYHVISPIEMDMLFDGEVNEVPTHADKRKFARRDTHVLLNEMKAENGDIVVMLPGWEYSKGANAERGIGIWVGLEILELQDVTVSVG